MKVFLVITEHEGETAKEGGVTSTKIVKTEYRYGAETIEEVYTAFQSRGKSGETETLNTIHEEHPKIIILTPKETIDEQ